MAAATNDTIRKVGSTVTLEASGASVAHTVFVAANDSELTEADVAGYDQAMFELITAGTFSAAPTAGSYVNLYEQKYLANGTSLGPTPGTGYRGDLIGTFLVGNTDVAQNLRLENVPINFYGGKYFIEFFDAGGTVSISAGWSLKATPYTIAPAP